MWLQVYASCGWLAYPRFIGLDTIGGTSEVHRACDSTMIEYVTDYRVILLLQCGIIDRV